jgi:TonB C terminal
VSPFLREHAGPLVGATTLHAVLLALAVAATLWQVTPKLSPPAAIEAYIAPSVPIRKAPPAPETVAPAPAPDPAPPVPAPAYEPPKLAVPAALPDHSAQLRALALADQKQAAAAKRHVAEEAAAAAAAAAAKAKAQRDAAAALAAHRADEARRKAATAAAAAADNAKRADEAQRAAREHDLDKQLAAEEHRLGAENSGLLAKYVSELQARIERAWNRPPTARTGLKCTVFVSQVPGGTVTAVRLGDCNGDAAVRDSITNAVYRASPLPAPPDPSLFERNLQLVFSPDD